MTISRLSNGIVSGVVLALVLLAVGTTSLTAQTPELVLTVDNSVVGFSDQQGVRIPVYMDNFIDSVAAFQFWIQLDRPDLILFPTDTGSGTILVDTLCWICNVWEGPDCVDSQLIPWNPLDPQCDWIAVDTFYFEAAAIDTVGTLVSGWDFVSARSIAGSGNDLLVTAFANLLVGDDIPPIPPQQGGVPLVYLIADVQTVPDSMTNESVNLHVETAFLDHFCFSTPLGQCIGFVDCVYEDTNYYVCTQWIEDTICLNWIQVSGPPADSIEIVLDTFTCLDTVAVQVNDGAVTVLLCGDVNGDKQVNVQDLSDLVDYLFRPPNPLIPEAANVDGIIGPGGLVDVGDLSYFVNYLFKGGPPPQCY